MLRTLSQAMLILVALFSISGYAHAQSNRALMQQWLKAFNRRDLPTLRALQQRFSGNSNIDFVLDTRDETGGFSLVRVESDTSQQLSVLLRQHADPSLWRLTLVQQPGDHQLPIHFSCLPIPVPASQAIASVSAFADRLAAAERFSGVIAIAHHGQMTWAKAWGAARRDSQTPIDLDTRFLFASQGKMFTAVAVLQLIEQGSVGLDDPLGRYLTHYSNAAARRVTIRELLNHTDGLGDIELLEPKYAANRAKVHSIEAILALNGERTPAFQPGSQFEYANLGFVILGAIVQQVSGQRYYDYVREHIFKPAGMMQTDYPLREEMAGVAVPYSNFDDSMSSDHGPLHAVNGQLPWRGTPAGGGVSTAGDMIRFVAALNDGTLLSRAMLTAATRPQTTPSHGFGFGFVSSGESLHFPYWGHGGGAPGQSLVLDYYPLTDTTFICMSNRDPPVCDRLAFNFLFRSRGGH